MDYDLKHGRTYLYFNGEPQYPFGHGLSYTTFAFANLRTKAVTLRAADMLEATIDVTNTGTQAGDEVVQLYVRFPDSQVARPRKQLRGFQRITLAAGETKSVKLSFPVADLACWSPPQQAWIVEPGRVELLAGNSSADAALTQRQAIEIVR